MLGKSIAIDARECHFESLGEHSSFATFVQYAKADFPDQLVFGPHGTRSSQLVTCGGPFDPSTGHYFANIVVFSRLVSVSRPKG